MKTLLLMKHVETGLDINHKGDWYRPLSDCGKMDASNIGELLIAKNLYPDLILTSSAIRTHQTAMIIANRFDRRCRLHRVDNLYLAETQVYYKEIQKVPDRVRTLLVVGHDPSLNRLMQVIIERIESIPTSGVACLTVLIDSWKDFRYDVQGKLLNLIELYPSPPSDVSLPLFTPMMRPWVE